jgi:hypothetical protein
MCGEVGILYPFSGDWGYGPTAQVGFIDGLGSPSLQKVVFVLVMICICFLMS